MRRDSADGLSPSSVAAARAEPRRTVRTNASSARRGGRRRIATSVQKNATRVESAPCARPWNTGDLYFAGQILFFRAMEPEPRDMGFVPGGDFDAPSAR